MIPTMIELLFSSDFDFLKKHTEIIELHSESGASVLVAPAWQGRVMTSSYDKESGPSFGWINRELIPAEYVQRKKLKAR